jgi:hypothetical protein
MAKNPAKNPRQKPAKNPLKIPQPKIHGKNLLKIPCGQKSAWISQKLLTIH